MQETALAKILNRTSELLGFCSCHQSLCNSLHSSLPWCPLPKWGWQYFPMPWWFCEV